VQHPDTPGAGGGVVALVALPRTREAGRALGLELAGHTVIHRTLAALEGLSGLIEIVLAAGPARLPAAVGRELQARGDAQPPVRLAEPAERDRSPWAALCRALAASAPSDRVLLLDGNRPLLSTSHLAALLSEVGGCPAVLSATPVRSTCKLVTDGTITSTLRRDRLLHTRRPGAFQRGALQDALTRAAAEGRPPAGDVALCQWARLPVRVVEGDAGNLPIETPADAELAELALRPEPLAHR
jgi:2-C-methyl-D-erythritol 4-phosphate cytidylyltransferase / 2-C-methyl-D-erythritol 2,4-cyclodiphosphate synthase